jgi:hypothetical protein
MYPGQNKYKRYKKNMKGKIRIPYAILKDFENL